MNEVGNRGSYPIVPPDPVAQPYMLNLLRKGRKLVRLLRSPIYWRSLTNGVAAAIEHEGAIKPLNLATVIDIGANRGQFSTLILGLFPDARVYAFEPLVEEAAIYQKIFGKNSLAKLYEYAAGNSTSDAQIHVSARPDSSSLLPITEKQNAIFPGTEEVSTRLIPVCRVDDVLQNAHFPSPMMVKLDVQGFELIALEGMPVVLGKAEYVYAEITFLPLYESQPLAHEIIAWLEKRGFSLRGIYNLTSTSEGQAVQADALFCRSERPKDGAPCP